MKGKSLIGFEYSSSESKSFKSFNVLTGQQNPEQYFCASKFEVENALEKANLASAKCAQLTGVQKAGFFNELKLRLFKNQDQICHFYCLESSLSKERFKVEFDRVLFQLDHFAKIAETNSWKDISIDTQQSGYDLRKTSIAIGSVVVFGASNFPLAYSTLGGDTVAAFTAGCPVIVKAHPMHPGTSSVVASIISETLKSLSFPDGMFSHLLDDTYSVAEQLILDNRVKAVGFTGSIKGGKALIDLSNQRMEPIPVFAEMGSVNPIVMMEEKLSEDCTHWSRLIASSISNDAGQFCTKPGLIFIPKSENTSRFKEELNSRLLMIDALPMLHPGIFNSFNSKTVESFGVEQQQNNFAQPMLISVSANEYLKDDKYREEYFGPLSVLVEYKSHDELINLIEQLEGQLTGTIIATEKELRESLPILELLQQKVGRLIFNGVPTGVKVSSAMTHGGPFPASSDSRFSAVGSSSVARFIRPITYQNMPEKLLPVELKNENKLGLMRNINGELTKANLLINNF